MELKVKPLHGGDTETVDVFSVTRFGRYRRYCDAKQRNIAQLADGRVVLCMQKDQSPEAARVMRRRLTSARFDTYASRERPEIFAWEQPYSIPDGDRVILPERPKYGEAMLAGAAAERMRREGR